MQKRAGHFDSTAGIRTRVARVKAKHPNPLVILLRAPYARFHIIRYITRCQPLSTKCPFIRSRILVHDQRHLLETISLQISPIYHIQVTHVLPGFRSFCIARLPGRQEHHLRKILLPIRHTGVTTGGTTVTVLPWSAPRLQLSNSIHSDSILTAFISIKHFYFDKCQS